MASCASWTFFLFLKKRGLFEDIIRAELLTDEVKGLERGFHGDAGRIGAHVGDQTDRFTGTQFDPFVELLGNEHGFLGRKAKLAYRVLLQLTGGKGRLRMALGDFLLNSVDDILPILEPLQNFPGRLPI